MDDIIFNQQQQQKQGWSCKRLHVTLAVFILLIAIACLVGVVIYIEVEQPVLTEANRTSTVKAADTILTSLRRLVGERPPIEIQNFSTWGKTTFTSNVYVTEPRTLHELQRVVSAASKLRLRVRCVGTAHSWGPLFAETGHVLLRTTSLRTSHDGPNMTINEPASFRGDYTVTAMSGLLLGEVNEFLLAHNFQLPAMPSITSITIGGMIGTASHGLVFNRASISEYIVAIRVVDSRGMLRAFNIYKHADAIRALQCCIGMCGVVYDVTFKIETLEIARMTDQWIPARTSLMSAEFLQSYLRKYQGAHFFWAPMSNISAEQLEDYDKTGKIPSYSAADELTWIRLIETPVYGHQPEKRNNNVINSDPTTAPATLISRVPLTTPRTTPAPSTTTGLPTWGPGLRYYKMIADYTRFMLFPENSPRYLYYPHAVSPYDATTSITFSFTIVVKEDANFTNTMKIMEVFTKRLNVWVKEGKLPIVVAEARYIPRSDASCYLCSWNFGKGNGYSIAFDVVGSPDLPGFNEFSREFFEDMEKVIPVADMRTHWSKLFPFWSDKVPRIRAAYGSNMEDFLSVIRKYKLDPMKTFINEKIKALFFP